MAETIRGEIHRLDRYGLTNFPWPEPLNPADLHGVLSNQSPPEQPLRERIAFLVRREGVGMLNRKNQEDPGNDRLDNALQAFTHSGGLFLYYSKVYREGAALGELSRRSIECLTEDDSGLRLLQHHLSFIQEKFGEYSAQAFGFEKGIEFYVENYLQALRLGFLPGKPIRRIDIITHNLLKRLGIYRKSF